MKARRNILLLVAAALAAVIAGSCEKIGAPGDDGWTPLAGAQHVTFNSSLVAPATKGALPSGTTFGVFAFYQPGTIGGAAGTWNSNRTPDFIFNQRVQFDGTNYTYSPVRYWPSNVENTLSFWAYSPYDASADLLARNSTNAYTNASKNIPDVRFTVSDGHTDFMYSNIVKNQTYASNSGVVPLEFNHALSLIDVRAEKIDEDGKYTVTLQSVSFRGLYMTAILRDGTWNSYSGTRQDIPVWDDDMVLSHASAAPVDSIMPLPQDLSNDAARLHVEFSVSYLEDPLDPTSVQSYSTSREVYLRDVFFYAGSAWTKNSHYVLTIKIQPDKPIQFTVSWSNWGDVFNYNLTD